MHQKSRTGRYLQSALFGGESYQAFIPAPLPPEPPLDIARLSPLVERAAAALGTLNGISSFLPDAALFRSMFVRKEAVLSSQIEGIRCSFADLLLHEAGGILFASLDDVAEVSCYIEALHYSENRLESLPLSLRLLRESHNELMSSSRGKDKRPGEFRSSQNWIGGSRPSKARFVPPPPDELMPCLDRFEKFLHDETVRLPIMVKAALAHYQFETIHPFLDGNGRTGRLLITLMLHDSGLLNVPLLYLSLFFKKNQNLYYDHLNSVRETGKWEEWVEFFLEGVEESANDGFATALSIVKLFEQDRKQIEDSGKTTVSLLKLYALMQRYPILTSNVIVQRTGVSLPTALRSLSHLEDMDIVSETSGKERHKRFVYKAYLDLLSAGTEQLSY